MKNLFEVEPKTDSLIFKYEISLPKIKILDDDTVSLEQDSCRKSNVERYAPEFWDKFFPLFKKEIPQEIYIGEGLGSDTTDRIIAKEEETLKKFIPRLIKLTKKALKIATKRMQSREPIQILP